MAFTPERTAEVSSRQTADNNTTTTTAAAAPPLTTAKAVASSLATAKAVASSLTTARPDAGGGGLFVNAVLAFCGVGFVGFLCYSLSKCVPGEGQGERKPLLEKEEDRASQKSKVASTMKAAEEEEIAKKKAAAAEEAARKKAKLVKAKLDATAKAEARFVVVGMSGHGKSTFLNGCVTQADQSVDSEAFAVAVSSEPCTTEVDARNLTLKEGWSDTFEAKEWAAVDTVGFPDTDKNKAAASYDIVANVINTPLGLNALVWIVKADRGTDVEIESIYEKNAKFMKELSQAKCKLVMIINGNENFQGSKYKALEKQGKLDEEKEKVRQQLRTLADNLKTKLGISVLNEDIYPSIDIEDFQGGAARWLFERLKGTPKEQSAVKSSTGI